MALFSEHMYTFLLDIRLGVKLLGQRLCIYLALGDTAKQFNKMMVPIYVPFGSILRVLVAPQSCQYLVFSVFFILAFLVSM